MLIIAGCLLILLSLLHSVLGERFILIRLFRTTSLPPIYGSDAFTRATLRFAWHITSVVWVGVAYVLLMDESPSALFLNAMTGVFAISSFIAAFFSRLKHFSWPVFAAISALIFSY